MVRLGNTGRMNRATTIKVTANDYSANDQVRVRMIAWDRKRDQYIDIAMTAADAMRLSEKLIAASRKYL
jgi:hypothetical protein